MDLNQSINYSDKNELLDNFYVQLESNDDNENTFSNFNTKLAKRLNLNIDWEVALTEISYHKSWLNVKKIERIKLIDREGNYEPVIPTLYPGHYSSPQQLIKHINDALMHSRKNLYIPFYHQPPELIYNEFSNMVDVRLGISNRRMKNNFPPYILPEFSPYMNKLLGLKDENNKPISFKMTIEDAIYTVLEDNNYPPAYIKPRAKEMSFERGMGSILVYTDIIKPVLVGSEEAQLLRSVEIPKNLCYKENCVIKYKLPYYHPIVKQEIETIRITLRDNLYRLIDFGREVTKLVLHFRKKR